MKQPLQLSTLALLLPLNLVHAISSHSPLDLLAHPAYQVKLSPGNPISNSSARRILAGGTATEEHEGPRHVSDLQIQQPKTGLSPSDDGETIASKPFLLRSAGNGQGYLCSVPQYAPVDARRDAAASTSAKEQPLTSLERAERRRHNEQEKRQAFERGLALLEPLKGACLYLTQGWFTYAFCHGSEIRQFHAIRVQNANGPGIAEDPTQDSYTLGQFSNRVVEDEGLMDAKKARALGSLREILETADKDQQENSVGFVHGDGKGAVEGTGDEKRYLVQRWSGGTLCDKTGLDRRVEVQFHCNSQSSDRIFLIRETAICEYVMVIHTPRLCGEPIFVGNGGADDAATEKRKKAVSVVDCRPILGDAVYSLQQSRAEQKRGLSAGEAAQVQGPASEAQQQSDQPESIVPKEEKKISPPSSEQTPLTPKAKQEQPVEKATQDIMESFVLVVDPATGEMVLEADIDMHVPGTAEGGVEQDYFGGKSLDEVMKTLQKSIEQTLNQLNKEKDGIPAKELDNKPQTNIDGQVQKEQASLAANQKKLEQLSRLTRSGAHNHKKIAEDFVNGQLKHKPRKAALVQPAQAQQKQAVGIAGQEQQQLGTLQHRNLKRAFDMKWDEDEEAKQRRSAAGQRQRDEL